MLKNYLKVALRNILRQKGYSFINIFGLGVGITCALLILMWVQDEFSWDTFHKNAKTLYRVEQDQPTPQGMFHVNVTPYPMAESLREEIPEVKNSTRSAFLNKIMMRYDENVFYENNALCVDPGFLEMFSYTGINGNIETALRNPYSMIITEDIAKKYFGNANPVGKNIIINNVHQYTVTAVIENIPHNTSLNFDILISFDFMKKIGLYYDSWRSNQIRTWIQLDDNAEVNFVNEKITEIHRKHYLSEIQEAGRIAGVKFQLMPLTDIRLYARFGYGSVGGTIQSIYIFSIMALFILAIACINYMNLSTARSAKRYKEIGLRKVVGAVRKNIIGQFYSESMLITSLSVILSLILIILLIPSFNELSGKNYSLEYLFKPEFIITILVVALFTAIISGTYPALILSSFQPIRILREKLQSGGKGSSLRKILVVFQFSLSVIIIVGTIVMFQQLQFMRNKNLGYDKEQLIYLPLNAETQKSYSVLRELLQNDPLIMGVSGTQQTPTFMSANGGGAEWDGKDPNMDPLITYAAVDYDYFETMKIPLIEGRSFSREFASDSIEAVLVNEEVAKLIGSEHVLGKKFLWANDGTIIGVAKNFHYQNLQRAVEPIAIYLAPQDVNYVIVRLTSNKIQESLENVEQIWQNVYPAFPFEYKFFDEDFAQMFQSDERMMSIFSYASLFAIIVACLGLFGLASFIAELRTKEIGIRKTLGASIFGITIMFSKEFLQWIVIANIIALPSAYFVMSKILEDYAYKTSLSLWIFLATFIFSIVIALITISYQTIKAALANPVDALKYE